MVMAEQTKKGLITTDDDISYKVASPKKEKAIRRSEEGIWSLKESDRQ